MDDLDDLFDLEDMESIGHTTMLDEMASDEFDALEQSLRPVYSREDIKKVGRIFSYLNLLTSLLLGRTKFIP